MVSGQWSVVNGQWSVKFICIILRQECDYSTIHTGNNIMTYKNHLIAPLLVTACLLFGLLSSCADDPVAPTTSFTVSGTLDNPAGISLPATVKLFAVWGISSGSPDYSYLYGEGSIDRTNNTFTLNFTANPQDTALNRRGTDPAGTDYYRCGVAYVILVDDPSNTYHSGMDAPDEMFTEKFYGAVNNVAVIYRAGNAEALRNYRSWLDLFNNGYSVGEGVEATSGFDTFTPIPSTNIKLRIDSVLRNFTFPNWT